ncbi:MAG TPA: Rieske 2Fe-2S domain-containing protein [Acidimicrobiales bacterium]|nr:Rieske 2Fe-2S domain-containing protein [Acidimicrobiales bacterium]
MSQRQTAPPRPAIRRVPTASPRREGGASWLWLAPPPRARHLASWALLPLRAFLGLTFCFAGLQKLANSAFFNSSNPASIQAQLLAASHRSPIHAFIHPLVHLAVPLGILIALGELAVGLGTLAGLFSRLAAAGGALISFSLFLAVSFHTNPYYTGSDIVFVFAWIPFLVAEPGPLSADAVLANAARQSQGLGAEETVPVLFSDIQRVCGSYEGGQCAARRNAPCEPGPCPYLASRTSPIPSRRAGASLDRRTLVLKGTMAAGLGAVGLVGSGLIAGVARLIGGSSTTAASSSSLQAGGSGATASTTTSSPGPAGTTASTSAASHPPGQKLGPASNVPVGGAASFQDPGTGDPALVVQPSKGTFLAFDAVCPHAGCTVEYSASSRGFICPCHGSQFDGQTGDVLNGPASSGLTRIAVAEGSDGDLYAQ